VKLDEYSLDDLHAMALAEFEEDDVATEILNSLYQQFQAEYVAVLERLRQLREGPAS
jgi:hypothetical protein